MNQFQAVARATGLQYPALKAGMNALWMKLVRGTEHPDLIVADAEVYATYESGLQENQRYTDSKLGGLGFETLKYKSAAIVFDGAATGISTAPAGAAYFLNTKYLKLEIYSGYNFESLDLPDQSPDMDAITKAYRVHGCAHTQQQSDAGQTRRQRYVSAWAGRCLNVPEAPPRSPTGTMEFKRCPIFRH